MASRCEVAYGMRLIQWRFDVCRHCHNGRRCGRVAGLIALLKPLFFPRARSKTQLTISVGSRGGDVKSIVLHGESGDEAIQKILKNLVEDKNGDTPPNPK